MIKPIDQRMSRNSIGKNLIVTSFGESHGVAVGIVMDGFPSNFAIDIEKAQEFMSRRRPGQSSITTSRTESDTLNIISGMYEGKTLGSPLAILIANEDSKPQDYDNLKSVYRPGHADWLYQHKYAHRDHRGGGRSSARITAGWVAAGALALQYLEKQGITIRAWVKKIYTIEAPAEVEMPKQSDIDDNPVRCWHKETAQRMVETIEQAKEEGDSLGGVIKCMITGVKAGIGEPVFGKLQAQLGQYLLNINAVKGIGFGEGFEAAEMKGSEHNDAWMQQNGEIHGKTNHSGGIVGGMSTGDPIDFQLVFKPTSTIMKEQDTVDNQGNSVKLKNEGRHDPCVLPRAVPIVEAMSALALLDLILESK